jgi:hypothetical protein
VSIELLELAADTLGELLEEVVFVGGATVTPPAPASRRRGPSPRRTAERKLSDLRRGLHVRLVPS